MFSREADLFFLDPHVPPVAPGTLSVLHMVRRSAVECLGLDPTSGEPTGHQTVWPGAMTVLAGVDLLGKFHAGEDSGKVGQRFRRFVRLYFGEAGDQECEILYQLRCSLLHSFGLYSASRGRVYRFVVTASEGPLISKLEHDQYVVDLFTLYNYFEAGIHAYQLDLEQSVPLQVRFMKMFVNYGTIGVGIEGD